MHPYLGFYDQNISKHLRGKASDTRKILEALLSKGKSSFFIVIIGTQNTDQNGEPVLPLPMLFDNLINARGFDGKLIVIDADPTDFKALAQRTSDKTTLVQEDYVSALHSLAANQQNDIDLIYFGESGDVKNKSSVIASRSMKALPVIQDILSDNTIVVLDDKQVESNVGQELATTASEYGKKPLVNNVLSGWSW